MGILTLLQHKEAAVETPAAKNTQLFIAETTEGAGENEVLAERPALKTAGAAFLRFIMGDSRNILGTAAPEAKKEITEAESVTGIEPSATKHALVWVAIKTKVETETTWKVEVGAVIVGEIKVVPKGLGTVLPVGTFYVSAGKKIKLTKGVAEIEKGLFSVQLMN